MRIVPPISRAGTRCCGLIAPYCAIALLALQQIDRDRLVGDALEIERDPDPIGGGGAEIGVKLHRNTSVSGAMVRACRVSLSIRAERVSLLVAGQDGEQLLLESQRLRRKRLVDGAPLRRQRQKLLAPVLADWLAEPPAPAPPARRRPARPSICA